MTDAIKSNVSSNIPISPASKLDPKEEALKQKFTEFVGDTFYRQLFKAMRAGTGKNAYMNGGQTEKIFQSQLDELLIQQMTQSRGGGLAAELFAQYQRQRKSESPPMPTLPIENPAESPASPIADGSAELADDSGDAR